MRHNLGLLLSTMGSILLGINVFRWGFIANLKDLPLVERWFFRLTGGKTFWEGQQKKFDDLPKLPEKKRWRTERTPALVAVVLMLGGFVLSLDYSALSRFWNSIF